MAIAAKIRQRRDWWRQSFIRLLTRKTRRSSQPLRICNLGKGQVLRKCIRFFRSAIEQIQLLAQSREACLREALREIFDHRAQTPHNLDAARAVLSDLVEG